jgi:hypothetical protein
MSTNNPTPGTAGAFTAATGAARAAGVLKSAWAALTTGSRAIPLGDNSTLIRDLAARIAASNRRA